MNHHRSTLAAAALAVVGMLAVGCTADLPESSPVPTVTAEAASEAPSAETGGADTESVEDEAQNDASAADPAAARPEEGAPDEALVMFDEPKSGVVPAPNGEMWDLHGSFDMDVMRDHFDATIHMETYDVDCDDAVYYWLREDEYGAGPGVGPTCFGEDGGRVPPIELRQIHYVCQAPNTTASTLISPITPAEESNSVYFVFTPEHTTGDERECFDFSGEEVIADQTVVTTEER